jgi:hypothetical protein
MIFDVDLYDIERPTIELFSETKELKYIKLDNFINKIIHKTLDCLKRDKPNTDKLKEINDVKIPELITRWTLGFKYSFTLRTNNEIYYDVGGIGDYAEFFLEYHFNNKFRFEFSLGVDFGDRDSLMNIKRIFYSIL